MDKSWKDIRSEHKAKTEGSEDWKNLFKEKLGNLFDEAVKSAPRFKTVEQLNAENLASQARAYARMNEEYRRGFMGEAPSLEYPAPQTVSLDRVRYCRTLRLDPNESLELEEVSSAYKELMKSAHPDKGGSHAQVLKLNEAKDYLTKNINEW